MRFYKLTLGNKSCLYEQPYELVDELFDMIGGDEPVSIQTVEMTEDEYEEIGDFDGW